MMWIKLIIATSLLEIVLAIEPFTMGALAFASAGLGNKLNLFNST